MKIRYGFPSLLICCLLAACHSNSPANEPGLVSGESSSLLPAELTGIWERRGYGDIFFIGNDQTTHYAITSQTCLPGETVQGLPTLSENELADIQYDKLSDTELSLRLPGTAFPMLLTKLPALPDSCSVATDDSAQSVFDHLWTTFNEYYAFFDQRGVDWQAQYSRVQPTIADAEGDEALFATLSTLLLPIDDSHVSLTRDSEEFSSAIEHGIIAELERGFAQQSDISDFEQYIEQTLDRFLALITGYFDTGSSGQQGSMSWATIGESTGYLFIYSMEGYVTNESEPGNSSFSDEVTAAIDLQAAELAIDSALSDLQDVEKLIIDVRINSGGLDSISLAIASRFTASRQFVMSKTASSQHYETPPLEAWLEPEGNTAFLKPVVLVTGSDTVSAAEIFTIAMRQLPNVTVIGETTSGALSDILEKPLPNGWQYGLSNEVYLDADGISYEGTGIPPDISLPVFRLSDIAAGKDPAIEWALAMTR